MQGMSQAPLVQLARYMQVNLDAAYRIDATFLAMHTGAALDRLFERSGIDPEEAEQQAAIGGGTYGLRYRDCGKVATKRAWLLRHARGRRRPRQHSRRLGRTLPPRQRARR
ncbi:MAG: hypothetical protein U5P41_07350 [Gammaproteobacteria bacterium]|nr:hypothetical protein [Gammaproteobacteria bacterium]